MNWTYQSTPIKPQDTRTGEGNKYQLFQNNVPLKFKEVIELWKNNSDFRIFYNQILKDSPFSAYFWEHPPMKNSTLDQVYEFVLINSKSLKGIWANQQAFQEHFSTQKAVVTFRNLSKKSMLIAPCPDMDKDFYAHISSFVRRVSEEQIHVFWETVAEAFEDMLDGQWRWLSTSGLGVYWLHVRIDDRPKYYTYKPYRNTIVAQTGMSKLRFKKN